ncbi:hypothetical protein DFH27DRAFT_582823 [Peziza echinospora]|nr:hypothetical protein DFH27DRAFT_582823 [Peziza echinospora]
MGVGMGLEGWCILWCISHTAAHMEGGERECHHSTTTPTAHHRPVRCTLQHPICGSRPRLRNTALLCARGRSSRRRAPRPEESVREKGLARTRAMGRRV